LDPVQHDRGGRKQAGIDGAADPEIEPGQTGCPGLELPAIAAPIDKERPYQRRDQRQDDRKRETEQRRLHALSTSGLAEVLALGGGAQASEKPDRQGVEHDHVYRPERPHVPTIPFVTSSGAPYGCNVGRIDGKSMSTAKGLVRNLSRA